VRNVIAVLEGDQRRRDAMMEEIQNLFPAARTVLQLTAMVEINNHKRVFGFSFTTNIGEDR